MSLSLILSQFSAVSLSLSLWVETKTSPVSPSKTPRISEKFGSFLVHHHNPIIIAVGKDIAMEGGILSAQRK